MSNISIDATSAEVKSEPLEAPSRLFKLASVSLGVATALVFVAVLLQLAVIQLTGDRWWFGTVCMFAPRWPMLGPVALLALLNLLIRPRLLPLNCFVAVIVAWPLMGWRAPRIWADGQAAETTLRVMTINAGAGASLEKLRDLIEQSAPDVVAIQESPNEFSKQLFGPDWHVIDQRNLVLASRFPIEESKIFDPSLVGRWVNLGILAKIALPVGEVWIASVYIESPRAGFESLTLTRKGIGGVEEVKSNTERRSLQSRLISEWVAKVEGPLIVMGDFNQPPESWLFRRDWSHLQDAFLAAGSGLGYSWHSNWHGIRIDRILASSEFSIISFDVDDAIGGDHSPLVAELMLRQ